MYFVNSSIVAFYITLPFINNHLFCIVFIMLSYYYYIYNNAILGYHKLAFFLQTPLHIFRVWNFSIWSLRLTHIKIEKSYETFFIIQKLKYKNSDTPAKDITDQTTMTIVARLLPSVGRNLISLLFFRFKTIKNETNSRIHIYSPSMMPST